MSDADAALVRCIDFEKAMSRLPAVEQAALLVAFRDNATQRDLGVILARSNRSAHSLVWRGLTHLADILDRRDLL